MRIVGTPPRRRFLDSVQRVSQNAAAFSFSGAWNAPARHAGRETSMKKLLPEDLDRHPKEVSRVLVLSYFDDVLSASDRLGNPNDEEALHDFRVSLRRLRSCIRAYRPFLKDAIPKKVRKELRSLASSTNTARDVEVQLAWLDSQKDKLSGPELQGLGWLMKRLEERSTAPGPDHIQRVSTQLSRIGKILTKRLSSWQVRLNDPGARDSFKSVIGSLVQTQLESISSKLLAISGAEDDAAAHSARIAAKRFRYLLEPIGKAVPGASALVKQLKELQDCLGDLHDTNLLVSTIGDAMEVSAAEGARRLHEQAVRPIEDSPTPRASRGAGPAEHPGLLELARLLRQRRQSLFSEVRSSWQGQGLETFTNEAHQLASKLQTPAGGELAVRRFRLTGLPEKVHEHAGVLVDEGWLPGKQIEDCLCRERSPGSVRHYRIVRVGSETRRTKIPRRLFARLWPLTEGRRLQKTRYEILESGRLWRVNDLGGNVVLAETNTELQNEELRLPEWIVPYLREELTGSARRSPPVPPRSTKSRPKQPAPQTREESSSPAMSATPAGADVEPYSQTISGNGHGSNGKTPRKPERPESSTETQRKG